MDPKSDHEHRSNTLEHYQEILTAVKEFIHENLSDDDCTLYVFCDRSGYSRRHTQRALAHFGKTWRDMVTSYRVIYGSKLLLETNDTVKTIARKSGYHQPGQFAKAFKLGTSVTPTEYRRNHAGNT